MDRRKTARQPATSSSIGREKANIVFDGLETGGANAFDLQQIFQMGERAVLRAVFHDAAGEDFADAIELHEQCRVRRVDIDFPAPFARGNHAGERGFVYRGKARVVQGISRAKGQEKGDEQRGEENRVRARGGEMEKAALGHGKHPFM